MQNNSGFHGYNVASLYPDMGNQFSDTMSTIPDPAEIEALSGMEPEKIVRPATNPAQKQGVWILLAVMVAFIFIFAKSG